MKPLKNTAHIHLPLIFDAIVLNAWKKHALFYCSQKQAPSHFDAFNGNLSCKSS